MSDITLPRANQALINQKDGPQGNAGTATREFYNFLRQLATLTSNAELQAEIDAILVRLEELEQGSSFTIQGPFSVAVTGQPSNRLVALALRNDVAAPGASFYYGTNSFGVKGWYVLPINSGGVLPIVTGEIVSGQPVFVIGPDGSLVYGPV